MAEDVTYPGRDLEAMATASRYHRWILEVFKPHLGRRLVEVGAGSGSFSHLLLGTGPESLSLVEPSKQMYPLLEQSFAARSEAADVRTYNSIFRHVAAELKTTERPDSIIYVNVLEHIADDQVELDVIHQTLNRGGRAFFFVPALPRLYSNFDESIGHYRRYTRRELEEKCTGAGFKLIHSSYFDLAGVLPWWVKYRLLKASALKPGTVEFYDRYVVPLTKALEGLIKPPLGKNIILIGEKQ
jgi:SAM-dependent methyltransferase